MRVSVSRGLNRVCCGALFSPSPFVCLQRRVASSSVLEEDEEDELIQSLVQGLSRKKDTVSPPRGDLLRYLKLLDTAPENQTTTTATDSGHEKPDEITPAPRETPPSTTSEPSVRDYVKVRNTVTQGGTPRVEWYCTVCETYNSLDRTSCCHCSASNHQSFRKAFPPSRQVATFPSEWICEKCSHRNSGREEKKEPLQPPSDGRFLFFCQACLHPFAGVRNWRCPHCSTRNPKSALQCAECFVERQPSWACPSCGFKDNSIFVSTCHQCQKTVEHKASNSVIECSSCHSLNDCRWELCESCIAPLPAIKQHLPLTSRTANSTTESEEVVLPTQTISIDLSSSTAYRTSRSRSGLTTEMEGAWWCTRCNILHRRNATFCDVCLTPRSSVQNEVDPSVIKRRQGDWTCPYCRTVRTANTFSCCGKTRQVSPSHWLCLSCGSVSHKKRSHCIGCGKAAEYETWECEICDTKNPSKREICETCMVSKEDHYWRCTECGSLSFCTADECESCSSPRKEVSTIQICSACKAPNGESRPTCFRCKQVLSSKQWTCETCGCVKNQKNLDLTCTACGTPRILDYDLITWVCTVCSANVKSGIGSGAQNTCVLCRCERSLDAFWFPTFWKCRSCGVGNLARNANCVSCDAKRVLAGLQTTVTCPECCKTTSLDVNEVCEHCFSSLQGYVSTLTSDVSTAVPSSVLLDPFTSFHTEST